MKTIFANNRRGGKTCIYLLLVFFAFSALPSLASEYTYWNGSVDSNWNTPGNWNQGLPSDTVYAQFGSPYDTPITLTIDGLTKVYAFYVSGSRTADLTFTGAGAFEAYRAAETRRNFHPSAVSYDGKIAIHLEG